MQKWQKFLTSKGEKVIKLQVLKKQFCETHSRNSRATGIQCSTIIVFINNNSSIIVKSMSVVELLSQFELQRHELYLILAAC
jgi:hypothetical protein